MDASREKLMSIKNEIMKQGNWNQYRDSYVRVRKSAEKETDNIYYKLMRSCNFEQQYMDDLYCILDERTENMIQLEQAIETERENQARIRYYLDSFRGCTELLLNNDFKLRELLAEKKLQNVAIYGAGRHGRLLLKYLNSNSVNVCCFIDKNTSLQDVEGVPVQGLTDEVRGVDLIVVTPYGSIEEIRRELKTNCVMMALNEFFDIKTWGQANGKK